MINQKTTDIAAIVVGSITAFFLVVLPLVSGSGLAVLNAVLIGFSAFSLVRTWRNPAYRQIPGVSSSTPMRKLQLATVASAGVWLVLFAIYVPVIDGILTFLAALAVVALLREIGFRKATPVYNW